MVVGDLATEVDVLVLGGGPGGYVAAIRAAQLGKLVTLVDPNAPGGSCLHESCIPSKALLSAAQRLQEAKTAVSLGISADVSVDFSTMQAWKQSVVEKLAGGVGKLLKANKVDVVAGRGFFLNAHEVRVEGTYGTHRYGFENCIIATGAQPVGHAELPFDGERVITAVSALKLPDIPNQICIVGSNSVAAELATLFGQLGSQTRLLIPAGETLLSEFDQTAGRLIGSGLKKLGVRVEQKVADVASATVEEPLIVVCGATRGNTADLALDALGVVADDHGFLAVNGQMQTSVPHVYAVGDVTGAGWATFAIKQGKVAAEAIGGLPAAFAPQALPRVAWTTPEVAAVGVSKAEAEERGYVVKQGRYPLGGNGRLLTLDAPVGTMLLVAEAESEVLLGATLIAPRASALINELALAIEMGGTLTDLAETLHPHPGMGEGIQELAEGLLGRAVHLL